MGYTVLIPVRLASTRLPDKALADIAGKPMVVRVAERAARSGADRVIVAADDLRIIDACQAHGIQAILTDVHHLSGSDRLAQACALLGLPEEAVVVNVQGDEALVDPVLIGHCAALLLVRTDCVMSTVAHPIETVDEYLNPNVVKVVLDADRRALLFSRAPLPWWRDGSGGGITTVPRSPAALRHVGLYGYRAGFLRRFPTLAPSPLEQCEALEQLRVLWHGERIAVHVAAAAQGGGAGVDTAEDLARVRGLYERGPLSV